MTGILLAITKPLIDTCQVSSAPSLVMNDIPPASIIGRAIEVISHESPINSEGFTTFTILWDDGSFYLIAERANPRAKWKVMVRPPLAGLNWTIKPLDNNVQRFDNDRDSDVSSKWSASFAKGFTQLPKMFVKADVFQAKVNVDRGKARYFMELRSKVPAWIIFEVDDRGILLVVDHGF